MDVSITSPKTSPGRPFSGFLANQEQDQAPTEALCTTQDFEAVCVLPADFYNAKNAANIIPTSSDATTVKDRGFTSQRTTEPTVNLDTIIQRIFSLGTNTVHIRDFTAVSEFEITVLCDLATKLFLKQPSLLELSPADSGLTIIGDLHGHLGDLFHIFTTEGSPDVHNYLFLGNYVDTGRHQVELICLLLCYKIKYPENFFLLRGAHESHETNKVNGFWHRCRDMYSEKAWKTFNHCFDAMPVAAVLGDRIICVHSGLSPELQTLGQLRNFRRPTVVPPNGLLTDMLWATPTTTTPGWNIGHQNTTQIFGSGVWKRFFKTNELEFMIRSHGILKGGFTLTNDKKVLSIFSATNFTDRKNDGAFVHLSTDFSMQIYSFDFSGANRELNLEST